MSHRLLGVLASTALASAMGLAGCGLPHVKPVVGGPTAGPSPYGPWYEQHWATNAVLLAAADGSEISAPAAAETAEAEPSAEEPAPQSSAEITTSQSMIADVPPPAIVEIPPASAEGTDANAAAVPAPRPSVEVEVPAPADGPVRY